MPVATGTLMTRPEEVVELLSEVLEDNAGELGIEFVGKYNEKMIPRYPAIIVSAGQTEKEVHASHTFAVILRAVLWVYHADMTITHAERSLEDLLLVTAIEDLLEEDKTYGERLVFGFVESNVPGIVAPRMKEGSPIVGTKMNWIGSTQKRWA